MGKNGWEARLEKYGLLEVSKQLSDSGKIGGKNSWAARLERFDPEEVTKQMSNMGTKSSGNVVRQVEAEEKQHKLSLLAESGEPFWIRAKRGDITANEGDLMCRSYEGKTHHKFTTIQVRHGEYVSVDELRYLDCPFVNNEVVDLSYSTMHVDHPIKGYSLKVPYGMVSKSNENGNALLMWYEKKAQ